MPSVFATKRIIVVMQIETLLVLEVTGRPASYLSWIHRVYFGVIAGFGSTDAL
jgi:hypothetical protein